MLLGGEYVVPGPTPAGTPPPDPTLPAPLPIPDGATPVTRGVGTGRAFPTIFAGDIVVTGPDTARAHAFWVDEVTREVLPQDPLVVEFVRVDGRWLLDSYREVQRG